MKRRNFIKASSAFMFLPLMESLSKEQNVNNKASSKLIFISYPWGTTDDWYPDTKQAGSEYELTPALEPLKALKKRFSIVSNLSNLNAKAPHSGCDTFLTGAATSRTPGRSYHNSLSCDQKAAEVMGAETRYKSIPISKNNMGSLSGTGPGFSLSWDDAGNSIPGIASPLALYDLIYGISGVSKSERLQALRQKQSVIDTINNQVKSASKHISKSDNEKLDQYFTSLRHVELYISNELNWINKPFPKPAIERPSNSIKGVQELEMYAELISLALQIGHSRVVTMRLSNTLDIANQRTGKKLSGHFMSHYKGKEDRRKASRERDKVHSEFLAYLMNCLMHKKDIDGNDLLSNTAISMGTGIRTGHNLKNLPIIVAGGEAAQKLKQGQHIVKKEDKTPLSNLWLTLLNQSAVNIDKFSDSNNRISELIS